MYYVIKNTVTSVQLKRVVENSIGDDVHVVLVVNQAWKNVARKLIDMIPSSLTDMATVDEHDMYFPIVNCMWREQFENRNLKPNAVVSIDPEYMNAELLRMQNAIGKLAGDVESNTRQIKKIFALLAKVRNLFYRDI